MSLQQTHNISWPDLYIQAELEREPFVDVHVVTAKSEYFSILQEMAITNLLEHGLPLTETNANNYLAEIVQSNDVVVYEQASISSDGIFVVINTDVIDDDATWKALDLVYKAVDNNGSWKSNTPLTFSISDMVNTH